METIVKNGIETLFHKSFKKDKRLKNTYLLVHSEKHGIDLNLAAGSTDGVPASTEQANYMASVGKIFTSTVIGMLAEEGKLKFDDPISAHLDKELMRKLHVFKGRDYSNLIKIRHLLNQTSGLPDDFWPLMEKLLKGEIVAQSTREAVIWSKENREPHFPPGKGYRYNDTNYHLLGFIIEAVTGKPCHEVFAERIFRPLGMDHSYILGRSEPEVPAKHPVAGFWLNDLKVNDLEGFTALDYTGGGVVATTTDLLKFMMALTSHRLVSEETLKQMMDDKARFGPAIEYGYGIWQITPLPLLMPKKYCSWGVLGATGAFLFYHPKLESYIIGTFNDAAYERKSVRFMMKVQNEIRKMI
ncbi:MAG: beta-lactamase family protein [Balneolaceae bacterium]|nr:beta-lactamase family protein [Balneolaceae bacterium]MCH8548390.1 beta-lactamase family protein [Balneolaceae bacterium]